MTAAQSRVALPFTMTDKDILSTGKNVLHAEAKALAHLAADLDESFTKAIRLIVSCEGRVVVSGMGKSGHVGRKISATMASTGTPSFFVHPGEASHGDLGMVQPSDVVIAISNSGETTELADLIAFTRRLSIPLIAITSREASTLAKSSDVVLLLPNEPEVSALGLPPTTSTTMTLALGDALAVAALEERGFSADDYHGFHPGGSLGSRLLRVSEIMHGGDELPLVHKTDLMPFVLDTMTEKGFGCAIIVDDAGVIEGIITDGDLRRHMASDLTHKTAADIMTRNPMTASPSMLAAEAVKRLNDKNRTQLLLADEEKKPVGLIHLHDLLRAGVF